MCVGGRNLFDNPYLGVSGGRGLCDTPGLVFSVVQLFQHIRVVTVEAQVLTVLNGGVLCFDG